MRRPTFGGQRLKDRFWSEAQFLKFIRPNEREIPTDQVRAAQYWHTDDEAKRLTADADLTSQRELVRSASA
jgi:hypothetical protein